MTNYALTTAAPELDESLLEVRHVWHTQSELLDGKQMQTAYPVDIIREEEVNPSDEDQVNEDDEPEDLEDAEDIKVKDDLDDDEDEDEDEEESADVDVDEPDDA
jgi:hypothetical protein